MYICTMDIHSILKPDNEQTIAVTTLFGLEELLADELDLLGASHVKIGNRVVHCKGNLKFIYKFVFITQFFNNTFIFLIC